MCQEITIFAKFSYTFVFSILDFDFNFEPEDFELIAFLSLLKCFSGLLFLPFSFFVSLFFFCAFFVFALFTITYDCFQLVHVISCELSS